MQHSPMQWAQFPFEIISTFPVQCSNSQASINGKRAQPKRLSLLFVFFFLFNLTLCDNDSTLKQIKRCERTQHSDSPIHSNRSFVNKMALVIHPSEKWSRKYPGSPYTKNGSARMTRYTWSRRKSEKGKDVSWVSCTAVVTWQFLKAWRSWYLF